MIESERLYTIKEVAKILGMGVAPVLAKIRKGYLKMTRKTYTRAYFVKGSELLRYIESEKPGGKWLSFAQVAQMLYVTKPAVSYMVKTGKLKCYKLAGTQIRVRFLREDVENYIKNLGD